MLQVQGADSICDNFFKLILDLREQVFSKLNSPSLTQVLQVTELAEVNKVYLTYCKIKSFDFFEDNAHARTARPDKRKINGINEKRF